MALEVVTIPTTVDNLDIEELKPEGLISDFTRYMFQVLVWVFLCGTVALIGIGTNIVNLVVFLRQGILTESVTASLAGLSLADLCCVTTMFFHSINYLIVVLQPPGIPWDPLSVAYYTTGWPRVMSTRVTCCITAYVALERCMCVVLPFKVKQLFTARRSIFVISFIFVFTISSYIPIFYTQRLVNIRDPATNITLLRNVLLDNAADVEKIIRLMNNIILPTIFLSIIIVCTRLTIVRLNASTKWRRTNANSNIININRKTSDDESHEPGVSKKHIAPKELKQKSVPSGKDKMLNMGPTASTKEAKVVKMITFICIIFLICNSPCVIIFYTRVFIPEISVHGRYQNMFLVLYSMDFLLETINSSINIIVYYKMSSKYKQEFKRLFGMLDDSQL